MSIARTGIAYGLVAATCLGLHNGIMIATDWALHRRASDFTVLVVGFLLSLLVVSIAGYLLHSRFTFREPTSLARYLRYTAAMSANTPIAFAVTWVLKTPLHLPMALAAPLASGGMVVVNFLMSRWAIRHPGQSPKSGAPEA